MITLFAVCKPMTDPHIALIQRNAITSWTKLSPTPEILLFGDRDGVPELAKELGVKHVKGIAKTADGVDRMDSTFQKAWKQGKHDLCLYINADIVLPPHFLDVVSAIDCTNYLMIGMRQNTPVTDPIDFSSPHWWRDTEAFARSRGVSAGAVSIDYFLHRRGAFPELPLMPSGGYYTDNLLIQRALDAGMPVIDASEVVFAVHQDHGGLAVEARHELPDAVRLRNMLTRGSVNISNATHRLRNPH